MLKTIVKMQPPEDVFDISRCTPAAMWYLGKNELKNKLVTIAERMGCEQADYSIRLMQSEQTLKLLIPLKENDVMKTTVLTINGPCSFFCSIPLSFNISLALFIAFLLPD